MNGPMSFGPSDQDLDVGVDRDIPSKQIGAESHFGRLFNDGAYGDAQWWIKQRDYESLRRRFEKACAKITQLESSQPETSAEPRKRMYSGVGHLEQTGYIPAGSAAARETTARTNQGDSGCTMPGDPLDYDRNYTVAELAALCRTKDRHIARMDSERSQVKTSAPRTDCPHSECKRSPACGEHCQEPL
jgi:hypothetical protein